MSSELESAVTSIVANDYVTLVILTAIGYDYILTFSDEIEYVWIRPWTWVSTMFFLVRYLGLCSAAVFTVVGSSFFPGPPKFLFGEWSMLCFIGAADLVMIPRIWAMYRGSKVVLGVLLALYALEMVLFTISCVLASIKITAVTVQVANLSLCAVQAGTSTWVEVRDTLQFVLAAVLFSLAAAKFVQHSFRMYKMTREWQFSRYVNLFARDGVLYFFAVLVFGLINVLVLGVGVSISGWQVLPIGIVNYVPVFTLTPRFILRMRALYAGELRGQGDPRDLDAGFGLTTGSGSRSGSGASVAFAGESELEGWERDEEVSMRRLRVWSSASRL